MAFGRYTAGLLIGIALAFGGPAHAGAGDQNLVPHLRIRDPTPVQPCAPVGSICFVPGARSTVAAATPRTAAGRSDAQMVPRFARLGHLEWSLDLSARLQRPAAAGNTIFLVYDAEDPDAVRKHEVTALYQTRFRGGRLLTASLVLSPEDGVAPGRMYRIRIVQLIAQREVLLAEGQVLLL